MGNRVVLVVASSSDSSKISIFHLLFMISTPLLDINIIVPVVSTGSNELTTVFEDTTNSSVPIIGLKLAILA